MLAGRFSTTIKTDSKDVLDPRVAYVLTTMMEAVINSGTGYPVRARGFQAPAAGKTGTSHDAWFAGYTTNLLCIVWVGNDDYTDLKLSRRRDGRAHLGRVHEAGGQAAAVRGHEELPCAFGGGRGDAGQSDQPAGDSRPVRRPTRSRSSRAPNRRKPATRPPAITEDFSPRSSAWERPRSRRRRRPPMAWCSRDRAELQSKRADGQPAPGQQPEPKKKRGFFSRLFGKGDNGRPASKNNGTDSSAEREQSRAKIGLILNNTDSGGPAMARLPSPRTLLPLSLLCDLPAGLPAVPVGHAINSR